jgi:pimeloyl-ACP methyl ester carboxylesterase
MKIDEAAVAAADFIRADGASQVVLIGASMGGTAVVAAAARVTPPVAGVISLSAPSVYAGVNAVDAARNLAVPVLYAVAEDDGNFVGSARALFDATPASVPRKLVVVPSGGHGVRLVEGGDQAPVGKDVDAFLAQYAPPG